MTPSPLDDCLTGLTPWKDVGLDRKLGIPKLILVLSGLGCVTLVRLLNLSVPQFCHYMERFLPLRVVIRIKYQDR